ncbi:MAG: 16S rRNA (cytidine(1402)-2'-O)-methyltransferase [Candidatus Bipolaricaulia bacterium]
MADATAQSGTLYLVATPIGHLGDITFRAVEVLQRVDLIIAEDTRRSTVLLEHYGIETPFGPSLFEGQERRRVASLIERLHRGQSLALVSDAGTPLVADPGFPLVRAAIEADVRVEPVPGPTALVAGLIASGMPTDRFIFDGTPPKKSGRLRTYCQSLQDEPRTVVLYESRHRILKTLQAMAETLPERRVALCRELTKQHEETLHGTPPELLATLNARPSVKGEFVIVLAGASD